jgi:hypothetical protein
MVGRPLLCAAEKGHEAVVKLLLKKGASWSPRTVIWSDANIVGGRREGVRGGGEAAAREGR